MQTTVYTLAAPQLATLIEAGELSKKLKRIEYVPVDVYHFGFDKKTGKKPNSLASEYLPKQQTINIF